MDIEQLAPRLWKHVDKTDVCWNWTGHVNWAGYGSMLVDSKTSKKVYVHRLSWMVANGPIPDRACVLHSCDNRRCVRPDHLRLGSRRENSADMVARGRSGKGSTHSQAVLTEDKVRAIRACRDAGMTQQAIADIFGVSRSTIGLICQGIRWTHVA